MSTLARLRSAASAALLAAIVTAPPPLPASGLRPNGGDFQVNDFVTGGQREPAVAAHPDGGFVVAWASDKSPGADTTGSSIQARRFDRSGLPIAPQIEVNSLTAGAQFLVSLAVAPDGSFLVAWTSSVSLGSDGSGSSIQARRFDASGAAIGDDFQLNALFDSDQLLPAVAAGPDGGFAIAWQSVGSPATDHDGTSIQLLGVDADGELSGVELQTNQLESGNQVSPAIAAAAEAGFVLAWESFGSDGVDTDGSARVRRVGPNGVPTGDEQRANDFTLSRQGEAAVAVAPAGSFVVVWQSFGSPGDDESFESIQARAFDADGEPLGIQVQVNAHADSFQTVPRIAADPAGGYLVVWQSQSSPDADQTGSSIRARRLDAAGQPEGDELKVNTTTEGDQTFPDVAAIGPGQFVVVWQSASSPGDDTNGDSVIARRFGCLLCDGFESETLCASWSGSGCP